MSKLDLAVLLGGESSEHEISLISAKNIIKALDRTKYNIHIIPITKKGSWFLAQESDFLLNEDDPKSVAINEKNVKTIYLAPKEGIYVKEENRVQKIDVVFPAIHGPRCEDGSMQGLLKVLNLPFVGCDVLGSAVCMDKDVMKNLLNQHNLPIGKFKTARIQDAFSLNYSTLAKELGDIMFVKPANMGSSVGVSRVTNSDEFDIAVKVAFTFDEKILIESEIKGREIEVAVLGSLDDLKVSLPGELASTHNFYSYESKYLDPNGAKYEIPAKLSKELVEQAKDIAKKSFIALDCYGMARVDLFLTPENKFYVNELNTIPGFTKISMYPKLWEVSGLGYKDLLDELIALALKKHSKIDNLT